MAKKKAVQSNETRQSGNGGGKESVAGYFRKVHEERPKLFEERSNDKLLQQWLKDHPGEKEVPKHVKTGLGNIKSVLRSKKRRKVAMQAEEESGHLTHVDTVPTGESELEKLEYLIDEALHLAKALDREGLDSVLTHLRRARNEVVWKIGQ